MQIDESSFPTSDPRPLDDKAGLYSVMVDSRARDEAYHHRLRLPVRCAMQDRPVETPNKDLLMSTIAAYRSSDGPPLTIALTGAVLAREVAPADWLEQLISTGGYEVLHSRRLPGRAGDQPDILTRDTAENGDAHISRWRAIKGGGKRGGRILVVQTRTPESSYPEAALDAFHSTISLDWANPCKFPFAENLETFSRPDPGDFLIYYPQTWERHDTREPDASVPLRISDLYHAVGDEPLGRITFICLRGQHSALELLNIYLRGLGQRACMANMGPLVEAPLFGDLEEAWSSLGDGHPRLHPDGSPAPLDRVLRELHTDPMISPRPDISISVKIGRRQDVFYLIGMMGLRRTANATVFAINQRAFDIVCGLMRTEPV